MRRLLVWGCPGCGTVAPLYPVSRVTGGQASRCLTAYVCAECFFELLDGGPRCASRVWSRVATRIAGNHALFVFLDRSRSEAVNQGDAQMSKLIPESVLEFLQKKLKSFPKELVGAQMFERDMTQRFITSEATLAMARNGVRVIKTDIEKLRPQVLKLAAAVDLLTTRRNEAAARLASYRDDRGGEIINAVISGFDVPPPKETQFAIDEAELDSALKQATDRYAGMAKKLRNKEAELKEKIHAALDARIDIAMAKRVWLEDQIDELNFEAGLLERSKTWPDAVLSNSDEFIDQRLVLPRFRAELKDVWDAFAILR